MENSEINPHFLPMTTTKEKLMSKYDFFLWYALHITDSIHFRPGCLYLVLFPKCSVPKFLLKRGILSTLFASWSDQATPKLWWKAMALVIFCRCKSIQLSTPKGWDFGLFYSTAQCLDYSDHYKKRSFESLPCLIRGRDLNPGFIMQ